MITVALIGPHGVGKTTLGHALASRLGLRFDDEIGRRLRDEALAHDPEAHALASGPEFDERVMELEWRRDRRARALGQSRIVESWHPINLAYAQLRSPSTARAWRTRVDSAMGPNVMILPLRMDPRTALRRLSEPGPSPEQVVEFFSKVAEKAEVFALRSNAVLLSPVCTSGRPFAETLSECESRIRRAAARSSGSAPQTSMVPPSFAASRV